MKRTTMPMDDRLRDFESIQEIEIQLIDWAEKYEGWKSKGKRASVQEKLDKAIDAIHEATKLIIENEQTKTTKQ